MTGTPADPARQAVAKVDESDNAGQVRLERLTPEIGLLLIMAGVVGVILPGVPGAPFLAVGLLVVTPGGTKRLSRWMGKNPPGFVKGAMKHLDRFLDDLERNYPTDTGKT